MSFATALREPAFEPRAMFLDAGSGEGTRALAREILMMNAADYAAAFKGSAIKRAKRRGLARNAAVVLGNVGTRDDVPRLEDALQHDEPIVREHAAHAIERLQARFR